MVCDREDNNSLGLWPIDQREWKSADKNPPGIGALR